MATKITDGTIPDVMTGSAEKRFDVTPDGTLWYCLVDPQKIRFLFSTDGGAIWRYASDSDIEMGQYSGSPSFFIDADGYAHVAMQRFSRDPQDILYARGTPKSGGGWVWSQVTISPAAGRLGVTGDVVSFRNGNGWVSFILYTIPSGTRLARVDISSAGVMLVTATSIGPNNGYDTSYSSVEFAHTGDGKTPTSTPHLFLVKGSQLAGRPLETQIARYASGFWTWEAPVTVASSQMLAKNTLVSVFDGTRQLFAWSANNSSVEFAEWTGTQATPVRRDPPDLPSDTGTIAGVSLSVIAGNAYLFAYGLGTNVIHATKLTRSTGVWSPWLPLAERSASGDLSGKVQALRYPKSGDADYAYVDSFSPTRFTVQFAQIVAEVVADPATSPAPFPKTPNAPILLRPTSGLLLDLSSGGTFAWEHSKTSKADKQQGFRFRRTTSGVNYYWNVGAQAWQTTSVFNATALEEVSFPPNMWTVRAHSWAVSTRSASGVDSPYSAPRGVVSTIGPVVNVTAPVGLYYEDSSPVVQWVYTSARAQRLYEIRIVRVTGDTTPDTNIIWSLRVTNSATARSARVDAILLPNVSYRAYVRARDSDGTMSEWDYAEFAISVEPPSGSQIEAFRYVDAETGVPRARLALTARSNFLSGDMARGVTGWSRGGNGRFNGVLKTIPATNYVTQIEEGFSIERDVSGNDQVLMVRALNGTPPETPAGEPTLTGPTNFPVTENQTYTFLAHVKSETARAVRGFIRWYATDDGTETVERDVVSDTVIATVGFTESSIISETYGDQVASSVNGYTLVSVTATAPFGAVLAKPHLEIRGVSALAEKHYFTRLSFHPGTSLAWQPGGYAQTQTIRVERSENNGKTWRPVVERVKPNYRQEAVYFDRSLPFGKTVLYRAFTVVDTGIGGTLLSESGPIATFRLKSDIWAIRDLTEDKAELNALVTAFSRNDEEAATVFRVAGREHPIVDTEGDQSAEGSLTVYVKPPQAEAMSNLLRSGRPLIVQSPSGTLILARFLKREYRTEELANRSISTDFVEVN